MRGFSFIADRIAFIEGGQVVEQGTHVALLARRGKYFQLYRTGFQK